MDRTDGAFKLHVDAFLPLDMIDAPRLPLLGMFVRKIEAKWIYQSQFIVYLGTSSLLDLYRVRLILLVYYSGLVLGFKVMKDQVGVSEKLGLLSVARLSTLD